MITHRQLKDFLYAVFRRHEKRRSAQKYPHKGEVIRTTTLIQPTHLVWCAEQYPRVPEIEGTQVAQLVGHGVHSEIETAIVNDLVQAELILDGDVLAELELSRDITLPDGSLRTIAGTIDLAIVHERSYTIIDWKSTRLSKRSDEEWRYQLSVYGWLLDTPLPVWAHVVRIHKDWHARAGARKGREPIEIEDISLLSPDEIERWVVDRVLNLEDHDGHTPTAGCPPNRRWGKLTVGVDGLGTVEDPERCIYHCRFGAAGLCGLWNHEQKNEPVAGELDQWLPSV